MQSLLKNCLLLATIFLGSHPIFGQTAGVFSLPYEGEEIFVTQEISSEFLGTYSQNKLECTISKSLAVSYLVSRSTNWAKEEIIWGVLVEDEQKVKTTITEYKEGKTISYEAFVVIIHNPMRNVSEEWMLYQLNGKYHFGKTEKIDAVAANK